MGALKEGKNQKRGEVRQMFSRKGKLGVSWYSDFYYKGKRYKAVEGRHGYKKQKRRDRRQKTYKERKRNEVGETRPNSRLPTRRY